MKIKEIRDLKEADIKDKLAESYKELMKENAQVATGTQMKNPGKVKLLKKMIARIKMVLSQKRVAKQ